MQKYSSSGTTTTTRMSAMLFFMATTLFFTIFIMATMQANAQLSLMNPTYWANISCTTYNPTTNALTIRGHNKWLNPGGSYSPNFVPNTNYHRAFAVTGNFELSMKLAIPSTSDFYIVLSGQPPMVQDEWVDWDSAIKLEFVNGDWVYWTHYPNTNTAGATTWGDDWADITNSMTTPTTLTITQSDTTITLKTNAYTFATLPNTGIFANNIVGGKAGMIYLSFWEATLGSANLVKAIQLITKPSSSIAPLSSSAAIVPLFLKDWSTTTATHSTPWPTTFKMLPTTKCPQTTFGAAAQVPALFLDAQYSQLNAEQVSSLTPEGVMKMSFVWPENNVFQFGEADAFVQFCQLNNIKVHGHTLLFFSQTPQWLEAGYTSGLYTATQIKTMVLNFITTMVTRYATLYPGVVVAWDVINEPFEGFTATHRNTLFKTVWGSGYAYIKAALQAVHLADPTAKLYINEWGCENVGVKQDALFTLAQQLLADGVALHGIGLQMHEDMNASYQQTIDTPSVLESTLRTTIQRFQSLNLKVRISELDINPHIIHPTTTMTKHGEWFATYLKVACEEGADFNMWGLTDRWSSLHDWWNYRNGYSKGLAYDKDVVGKTAVTKMYQYLYP